MAFLRTAAALTLLAMGATKDVEIESAFKDFVAKFGRRYRDPEEEAKRFAIFESPLD